MIQRFACCDPRGQRHNPQCEISFQRATHFCCFRSSSGGSRTSRNMPRDECFKCLCYREGFHVPQVTQSSAGSWIFLSHQDVVNGSFCSCQHACRSCTERAYDLLLSPSRLKSSMILMISFLPSLASTLLPPMLILTFSWVLTWSSLLSSKCLMLRHTNTPQSDKFSCCGLSCRLMNLRGLLSSLQSFWVTW